MKASLFFLLAFVVGNFSGSAQLVIQSGAQLKATNEALIALDNIDVINDDAASDFSSSVMMFKGNTSTSIGGSGNWTIKKILLHKPSTQLNLLSPVTINERLQLVNGRLDLNGQMLTLFAGATVDGENEDNHILGPTGGTVQTTVLLNVPGGSNPGNLGAVISSSQNLGLVTVKRSHATTAGEARVQRFYEIIPENNTGLNATIRLHYLDAELNNVSEPALSLYTRSNSSQGWSLLGYSARDGVANYVEMSGLPSLQQFSLAAGGAPLPLVWGPVSAACQQNEMAVSWITYQEANVQQFVVQRSHNASQWTDIATVPATGNSTTPRTYSYTDGSAGAGKLYYRIRSEDIDRKFGYSSVTTAQSCSKKIRLTLAPVPARVETVLTIKHGFEGSLAAGEGSASIKLVAADGRVLRQQTQKLSGSVTTVSLSLQGLANGFYYVEVLLPDGTREVLPLAKQ